jgi:hypothetical protein
MNTKEIAREIVEKYGSQPALELIDKARADGFLTSLGVTNILEVFHIAQELNKGENK